MLFAGSRSEVGPLLGIGPDLGQPEVMQERNQICLQSDPPQCFDIGNPFEQAESGGITNKVFDKSLTKEGGFKPPLPGFDMDIREILRRNEEKFKAEVPETWNEGTGIEKGGYENAPQWLRDQLWKQDLRRRQELGLEPVVS